MSLRKKGTFQCFVGLRTNITPDFSLVGSCELAHELSCECLVPAK